MMWDSCRSFSVYNDLSVKHQYALLSGHTTPMYFDLGEPLGPEEYWQITNKIIVTSRNHIAT